MDPSCTIGFLCPNLQEFHKLRIEAEKVLAPPLQKGVYPFFSFSDLSLEEMLDASVNMQLGSLVDNHLLTDLPSPQGRHGTRRDESTLDGLVFCDEEDFVVVECMRTSSELLEGGSDVESRGPFAEAEDVGATTKDERTNGDDGRGEGSRRGVGNGDAINPDVSTTDYTSTAPNHGHTGTHLGYLGQVPGLLPVPPPLDSDDSLPTVDADPFS